MGFTPVITVIINKADIKVTLSFQRPFRGTLQKLNDNVR